MLGISVVVASYRRPEHLVACLDGLRAQTLAADEVIVVGRASDPETAACVAERQRSWPQLRWVLTSADGTVAAYNRGLETAVAPIVAYIDDDAVPATDWTHRLATTYAQNARIGAVGGRDIVIESDGPRGPVDAWADTVGRIRWFGRMVANHHVGRGPARDVDFLKGVNMSFRRSEVIGHGFDERLRGYGAQVHSELSICLPLRRRGVRVVYDPAIVVMHYPAPRPAGDDRHSSGAEIVAAAAHNEMLAILDYLSPTRRLAFTVWGALVGSTEAPGVAVSIRDLLRRRPAVGRRFWATQRGRAQAFITCRHFRGRFSAGEEVNTASTHPAQMSINAR